MAPALAFNSEILSGKATAIHLSLFIPVPIRPCGGDANQHDARSDITGQISRRSRWEMEYRFAGPIKISEPSPISFYYATSHPLAPSLLIIEYE